MAQSLFFCFCTQATPPPERGELSSLKAPTTKKTSYIKSAKIHRQTKPTLGPSAVVQRARRRRVARDDPHYHVREGRQAGHGQHAHGVEAARDLEGEGGRREVPADQVVSATGWPARQASTEYRHGEQTACARKREKWRYIHVASRRGGATWASDAVSYVSRSGGFLLT